MAAQTAAQKAADAKVEANKAADEKVAAEAEAANKAADEAAKKSPDESAAPEAAEPKATHVVTGIVAVLPLKSGGERYVHRGAPVGDEYTEEGVKHAVSVGLVETTK